MGFVGSKEETFCLAANLPKHLSSKNKSSNNQLQGKEWIQLSSERTQNMLVHLLFSLFFQATDLISGD